MYGGRRARRPDRPRGDGVKIADEQLFYLQSRGLSQEQAMGMIVNGFIEPVTRTLPMEYAVEWSRLIELQMEGSVG
ncbi:MAG: SufD family Fe-S cluster assembly protein [Ilumatobacteraceae bacterium]